MMTTTICSSFIRYEVTATYKYILEIFSNLLFALKCIGVNLTRSGFLNIAFYFRNDDSSCIEEESLCVCFLPFGDAITDRH